MSNYSNAKAIFGLTTLIRINEKRIRYYRLALNRSDDVDLILWFNRQAGHLQSANTTLKELLSSYKEISEADINPSIQSSHWEHFRDLLILTRRNSLVDHCEMLERNALKIYRTAIALSFIPTSMTADVQEQIEDIEEGLINLKAIRQPRQLQVA